MALLEHYHWIGLEVTQVDFFPFLYEFLALSLEQPAAVSEEEASL